MSTTHEVPNINERQEGDCGYVATFKGQQVGIYAKGLYPAQKAALEHFKPNKRDRNLVSVMYVENGRGEAVPISTGSFG